MTTEAEVSPGAETEIIAPEQQLETTPEAAPETDPSEQQPEVKDPVKELETRLKTERANFDRRISRKHAEFAREKARADQFEQQLARHQTDPAETPAVDVEALAAQKAEQITAQRELSRRVQDVLSKGSALPEFSAHCSTAIEELGLLDGKGQPTAMLSVFLEADTPHEVLDHIGKNPEVAAQFDGLTPTQAARRLVKLEAELAAAKAPKVSAAPKPLKPVGGSAGGEPDPSAMTDKQFAEWRRQQIAARRA